MCGAKHTYEFRSKAAVEPCNATWVITDSKTLDSLCVWIWILGALHIYKPFTITRLCTARTIHSPQREAMVLWAPKSRWLQLTLQDARSPVIPQHWLFLIRPICFLRKGDFLKPKTSTRVDLNYFRDDRTTGSKEGFTRVTASRGSDGWRVGGSNRELLHSVPCADEKARELRDKQAGRHAGCASGPEWPRFSSCLVSIHVGHQLTGLLLAFPN